MSPVLVRILLVGSMLLLVVAWWQRESLPRQQGLDPALLSEPQQLPTTKAPFKTRVGGVEYTVRPLYSYDLYGLVVSKHDADTWWDYIPPIVARPAQRRRSLRDLGRQRAQRKLPRAGLLEQPVRVLCPGKLGRGVASLDMSALSNNHLLTDDPVVARTVKGMRVGDQVHVRGYLAEYSHDQGFHFFRGTSPTRNDQGAHACETVYATDAEILRAGNGGWRAMFWVAAVVLVIGIVGWMRMPFRATR